MSKPLQNLGGRVPLFDPQELTAAQEAVYETVNSKMVPWAQAAGFQAKLDDGKLVGPFNTILLSPEIAASFLALQASEQEHTSLSERVRQVVILTVGAVWNCDYERYAHAAVAREAGFSEKVISALAEGTDVEGLSATEQLAQRVTWQLTAEHRLSAELYSKAVSVLGARGIVDLIFLAGCYQSIAALLNAFQVPVPQ
ncbi:carboxymuconolactone decarboxylase family protein [Burkholderia sp. PAMC 26561]|uniref:carboxymuconolactone decarboxylase family protein n=1 Tax=Burkholderia sp. PAMC 26561 TaxID=1795043 RepID=UPI00076B8A2C|nr:carboxymuconolactone decarboxylase family protein [Burkholderia sp. PAMC 26561]AME27322.1 hypothetical protein AXG89_25895 [Burkholderia sp. PAMC 26561]AME27527.1 hypothetical protein AXG89_26795 [Burkholderia sp. PAMC 26561]